MSQDSRGALSLVDPITHPVGPTAWFCGHCGAPPSDGSPASPSARVCASCGLGLLHQVAANAAPKLDDAFAIIDSALTVQAVSRTAESIFGVAESDIVNRPLTDLVLPADAEADQPSSLAALVFRAASGGGDIETMFVRPATTFGVRLQVRIAACGPPSAALLALT